ncbi:SNF1-related protein kinase regulatory subunit gamma-1-like isoform X2 [Phalaenopsis equestris]|uniref:SNF1-related protein kinase regulatory subunit gamma-1-like isoform X2 n=1 Tax=Phalaenopsis equestris TaxID=78828 RepID=UPI0009E40698|nr:SNF1-related protein kinase regulatory subunit gamma-1-like isoform X2 [Phalaenopsis equestris]
MESPPGSARSSPEAEVGMRVEDLWEIQEPQLSPSEKLNSCFESIFVSSFPQAPSSQVIEISSDSSLAEAVEILSNNRIVSAPVRNLKAPANATWIDRYIGIVEFAGITVWLLHQSEMASSEGSVGPLKEGPAADGTSTAKLNSIEAADSMGGTFLETLTTSDFYKKTKVEDISGSFRWAPFLALQKSDSFLTMLLLLSKYRMKSLPVVVLGEEKIDNIITQSAVVHMLAECVGLPWFENWGRKKLHEVGLPSNRNKLIKVREDESVLMAFQLMRKKRIGGVPVVDKSGKKAVGNISIRDVQYLLTAPEMYKSYRSITAKDFVRSIKSYLSTHIDASPRFTGVLTCSSENTIKEIILKLDAKKVQRIYVVDEEENLEGVITLRDIISKLVHEPNGYFGDFFDGVVPLPQNSRV